MTKYCNITKREDSARIGLLKLDKKYETPLLIDDELYNNLFNDLGTYWIKNNDEKFIIKNNIKDNNSVIILPRYQTTLSYPFSEYINNQ